MANKRAHPPHIERGPLVIRNLPIALKAAFRSLCFRRGVSMSRQIEQLIKEDLKKAKEDGP